MKQLARDKIAQEYLGETGSEFSQKRTRDRINWFVEQIERGEVLDIGCSEGILPIVLGRKGIDVVGVDINPDAIEFAKELLAREESTVAKHVTFICDDITRSDWPNKKYQVVVMGEIIEHFSKPENLIDKAISLLEPGGLLLVTTPFGLLPDPDHRITFMMTNFLEYFRKYDLRPISLTTIDGYIRFAALNLPALSGHWERVTDSLLAITEQGFLEYQNRMLPQISSISSQYTKLNSQYTELSSQYTELETEYSTLKNQAQLLAEQHTAITESLTYQVSREIASAVRPVRFSSLLLPFNLIRLVAQRRKRR